MPKNTYYIKNEIKKLNEVYELKRNEYQVPSFEEFMKSYERDEKVNYSDLESGNVDEFKGYGPCKYSRCPQPSSLNFHLKVRGINEVWWGGSSLDDFEQDVNDVEEARKMINEIDEATGYWEDKSRGWLANFYAGLGVVGHRGRVETLTRQIRNKLIELIREAIRKHEDNGQYIDGRITVREGGGGDLNWSYDY